jgi:hypothetical protein
LEQVECVAGLFFEVGEVDLGGFTVVVEAGRVRP